MIAQPQATTKYLTARQKEVLASIVSFQDRNGYPPTVRELGAAVGISSPNGVVMHLKKLEREGVIRRSPNSSRGIEVLTQGKRSRCTCPECGKKFLV